MSLSVSPLTTGVILFTLILMNVFTFLPPFSPLALLVNYYLLFAYVVFVSKKFVESGGEPASLKSSLRTNPADALFSYPLETAAVLLAQLILSVGAVFFALVVFGLGGVWSVIKPLLEGGDVSWAGLLISLGLALFVYFSVVTSFPLFFGRAMLREKGFSGTLRAFVTSLYAEISWKTMLSCDYVRSSVVISLITLAFVILHGILTLVPPLLLFAPVLTFLTVHLLYLFGTVAAFRLLHS